ncbi:MAG: tail fiber domain-containing protein [Burkholderiaceae bacterium]|jgi:hypothetical protein|nr:tail fiber domain-containing protein [Burkholderiaceae bacterium]
MAWQSSTINPATTSPAADITKLTNDLQVLRSVLGGSSDGDVPLNPFGSIYGASGNVGIGNSSPSQKLTVTGNAQVEQPTNTSVNLNLVQSGIAIWTLRNVATSGHFAIADTGGTQCLGIYSSRNVGIGTSAPPERLTVSGNIQAEQASGTAVNIVLAQSGIGSWTLRNVATTGAFSIVDNTSAEAVRINGGGSVFFPSIGTTASAANAFLNSGSSPANQLLRSTSSLRYKTDVRDLPASYLDAVMELRPVVYKSNAEADDQSIDWVGLIAEEVAEVAPRLVHYTTLEEDGPLVPDGVQYDRVAVLLLAVVKQQAAAIEALTARVAALEAA